jgi:hypothetical protein
MKKMKSLKKNFLVEISFILQMTLSTLTKMVYLFFIFCLFVCLFVFIFCLFLSHNYFHINHHRRFFSRYTPPTFVVINCFSRNQNQNDNNTKLISKLTLESGKNSEYKICFVIIAKRNKLLLLFNITLLTMILRR